MFNKPVLIKKMHIYKYEEKLKKTAKQNRSTCTFLNTFIYLIHFY